jgi:hypothetical protein
MRRLHAEHHPVKGARSPYRAAAAVLLLAALAYPPLVSASPLYTPLVYPDGTIGTLKPVFIWQDSHTSSPAGSRQFRITITKKDGRDPIVSPLFAPQVYYRHFLAWSVPGPLQEGTYSYTIERATPASALTTRYFHAYKYPITGEFTIEGSATGPIDGLETADLIRYLYLTRENTLRNGYSCLFFTGSGLISFGLGMIFLFATDFGVISTVIYSISFASAAAGFAGAGYYGYHYFSNRKITRRILDVGGGVSVNGGASRDGGKAEIELRF